MGQTIEPSDVPWEGGNMLTSCCRLSLHVASLVLVVLLLGLPQSSLAQEPYSSSAQASAPPPRPVHRLVTVVPRLGLQLGTWVGDLRQQVSGYGERLGTTVEASGGISPVLGADLLFRLRSGMRLGAGLYVMPRVTLRRTLEDEDGVEFERDQTLGTLVRVPFVIEWEIPVAERVSLVAGAVPGFVILARGEQEENRVDAVCEGLDCDGSDPALGPFLDGELGALVWLDRMALRFDVRMGLEILSLLSVKEQGYKYEETLSGLRMQLLAGVEL